MYSHLGDVGLKEGLVGEYRGEVGLNDGDCGLYRGDVGEKDGEVGEYRGLEGEKFGDVRLSAGDVGEYVGDVAPPRPAKNGDVANGDAPNGDVAVTPNGDVGAYGDVGEYDPGELGLYPPPGDAPPEPAPIGLCPNPRYEYVDGSSPPLSASGENAAASPLKGSYIGEFESYGVIPPGIPGVMPPSWAAR